ncbi:MAG: TIGR04255 family protein [Acetobacteraceae bacterium]
MPSSTGVKFDRPPVVEVACGVLFDTAPPLRSAYLGLYWKGIRKDFPKIEEALPLARTIEPKGPSPTGMALVGIGPLPPLRRTWFVSEDGCNLIQVQEDRFLFNWKRTGEQDNYPSYEQVVGQFNRRLAGFLAFLDREGFGLPTYRQFELTYVNQIPIGQTPEGLAVRETTVLVDHVPQARPDRFLPEPEAINWTSIYPLPNGEGRLHAAARSGFSEVGARVLHLEMTARGIPTEASEANRQGWFDQAHCWITRGFADLTAPDIQRYVWKRTK